MVDLQDDSINLRALKKIDNYIMEILFSAGQVAIYNFDVSVDDGDDGSDGMPGNGGGEGKWKRKEIEGALFFVRRSVTPEYAFVVLNKLNTMNLVQKITKDLETNVQQPYLMYKNSENEIYCVWFYDRDNCPRLNSKIVDAIANLKKEAVLAHSKNSLNQFNGLNTNSSNSTNSDFLKKMLSVDNNSSSAHEAEVLKKQQQIHQPQPLLQPLQPNVQIDLAKPIAQRRSLNLKDLFESQLTVSSSDAFSTPLKGNEPIFPVKQEPVTPYQYLRDESAKNNNNSFSTPRASQANLISTPEVKPPPVVLESMLQPHKLAASAAALYEANKNAHKSNDTETPLYLTMEQLKKTLIYLLQNDADFLHTIHTAYVGAIKK